MEAATLVEPSCAQVLTSRGVVHQFNGDLVCAMRDYRRAILAEPTYKLAYYNAANVYLHQRQYKQVKRPYSCFLRQLLTVILTLPFVYRRWLSIQKFCQVTTKMKMHSTIVV